MNPLTRATYRLNMLGITFEQSDNPNISKPLGALMVS